MPWSAPAYSGGVVWEDFPSQHTPLNAADLNLEENAEVMYAAAVGASVVSYFESGESPVVPNAEQLAGGSLGASYPVDFGSKPNKRILVTGTLTANCTITFANRAAGCHAMLLLTQDATGGRTLTVSDGTNTQAVPVASAANSNIALDVECPDAIDIYVSALAGQGLPTTVATVWSAQASASTPTLWLDTYYDSAIFANKSAAIQAAVNAAVAGRAVLECQAKRVYSVDTTSITLSPNQPLTIEGRGATWQSNWTKPRILDFARVADGDTFTNVDVRDLTFDANSKTSATSESVVGVVINGGGPSTFQRLNWQHIYFRRCKWLNVPVSNTTNYVCFGIYSSQLTSDQPETQNSIIDVRVEQGYMRGGNFGAAVVGTSATLTGGVNVYHDQIYIDVDHDTGVVPTSSHGGANVQVGSLGWGDRCEVHVKGANSPDVGVEIDGIQRADVYGTITDAYNAAFFARNFHAPLDVASQVIACHNCVSRVVNLAVNPATGPLGAGFQVGGSMAPDPGLFGEFVLDNCSHYSSAVAPSPALVSAAGAPVDRITIIGTFKASYPSLNWLPAAQAYAYAVMFAGGENGRVIISGGRISITFAGTVNANVVLRGTFVAPPTGSSYRFDLDDVTVSSSLAGMNPGNTSLMTWGTVSGTGSGGSVRGRIKRLGWRTFSGGDTAPKVLNPAASTVISIDNRLVIDEIDQRNDPAVNPQMISSGQGVDTANLAKLVVRSWTKQTYPIPSSAPSAGLNFATTNFTTAVGNQYIGGLPAEIQFATGTGAGITAIDVSKDGTTYENAYTQASGAMAQSVIVPVENGDFVKVTFTTTQPTTRVRYRRAQ